MNITQLTQPLVPLTDPFSLAIERLQRHGMTVSPTDIPGLVTVPGHPELTMGQVIDLASQLPS